MEVWKIIFLSKWVICRFHVNLPGCTVSILIHALPCEKPMLSGVVPSTLPGGCQGGLLITCYDACYPTTSPIIVSSINQGLQIF